MAPPVGADRRPPGGTARRVLLLLLLVPVVEVVVIVLVAHLVGGWTTLLLLLAGAVLGSWLVRREGVRTVRTMSAAVRSGGLPAHELSDAALVLVGGVLILVPGFLTDLVGLVLVLPPTRPLARRLVVALAARRLIGVVTLVDGQVVGERRDAPPPPQDGPRGRGEPPDVIEGRVL